MITEVEAGNGVRFLDEGRYLYMRNLQQSNLERQYHCAVTNARLNQKITAPTRYILNDNLTMGELSDYKQIGNLTAFVGIQVLNFLTSVECLVDRMALLTHYQWMVWMSVFLETLEKLWK